MSIQNSSCIREISWMLQKLEAHHQSLWRALTHISAQPNRSLLTQSSLKHAASQGLSSQNLVHTLIEPRALAHTFRKPHFEHRGQAWRFLKVYVDEVKQSTDTLPNQMTAYVIKTWAHALRNNIQCIQDEPILHRAQFWLRRLLRLMHSDFWRKISALQSIPLDNLAMNHHPDYRQVLDAYWAWRSYKMRRRP